MGLWDQHIVRNADGTTESFVNIDDAIRYARRHPGTSQMEGPTATSASILGFRADGSRFSEKPAVNPDDRTGILKIFGL